MITLRESWEDFMATWILEDSFWPNLIQGLPRKISDTTQAVVLHRDSENGLVLQIGPSFKDNSNASRKAMLMLTGIHYLQADFMVDLRAFYDPQWHLAVHLRALQFLEDPFRENLETNVPLKEQVPGSIQNKLGFFREQINRGVYDFIPPTIRRKIQRQHQGWTPIGVNTHWSVQHLDPLKTKLAGLRVNSPGLRFLLQVPTSATPKIGTEYLERKCQFGPHLKTRLQTTNKRTSRRYHTVPGHRVKKHLHLLAILDTSKSVSPEDLQLFFQEIQALHSLGHQITIMEADLMVQSVYPFRGFQPARSVKGGGGTNFDPAIEQAENRYHPDLILYFTDGEGPTPLRWQGTPLLWYLTGTELKSHLPGEQYLLNTLVKESS